VTLSFNI